MKIETYSLSDLFPGLGESRATVEAYWQTADDEIRVTERPAMVIFPGGGYAFTSHREAEPIALRFASLGYQCFVVWYSCKPARHPLPLLEGAAAVAFVRRNAVKFGVDPRRIAVIGFSAGGHCAGAVGTLFADPIVTGPLKVTPAECRPDGMVLCYSVITAGDKAHVASLHNLLGEETDPDLMAKLSLETSVTDETPPTFLWTSANDGTVPCENTLLMAQALAKHKIPFEVHIWPDLPHGASLANDQVYPTGSHHPGINARVAVWPNECHAFLTEEWRKRG